MKKSGLVIWALARLPMLAAGLYLFRFQIVTWIEETIGLDRVMNYAVFYTSTFWTRFIIYLVCVTILALTTWLVKKWGSAESWSYHLLLMGIFIAIYFSFAILLSTPITPLKILIAIFILAVNTLPEKWLMKWIHEGRLMNFFFIAGVGLCEAFFPQAYVLWLTDKLQSGSSFKKWSWLSGVIVAPLFWVFLLTPYHNEKILTLNEKLHASPAVEKFAEGDFNWIEFDPRNRLIYAVGRGANTLFVFDPEHLDQPPRTSKMDIGITQSFAFNPDLQELYVYNDATRQLLYLDSLTLGLIRSVPIADISPGDVWVIWNRNTDSIIIASEADLETGTPFVMIDRASGDVLATLSLPVIPTAFMATHPEKPLLYFNSFTDTYLVAWDMQNYKIIRQVQTSARTDRMAFLKKDNELLIASPMEGAILRYDPETLELKGRIEASFGDRTLAIDPQRNLLLAGNFINNKVQVIDLNTHKPVASFYLGPWIRTITLDVEQGIAYVSTLRNLFKVQYTSSE